MSNCASPVCWLPDGTPRSARFNDIYRSQGNDGLGGLAQARHVFLGGCGLLTANGAATAWHGKQRWTVLETGFGLGLNFLATWQAWRTDPVAPASLHYVAVEAWPPTIEDLLRSIAAFPELAPLAQQLAANWAGLLPGFHRLVFEEGRVQLTLCVGEVRAMLREQHFEADSVFLDGFDPSANPDMWDLYTLKAVARLCRRGARVATWTVARNVRDTLAQCGFVVEKAAGLPPKRDCLRGRWDPAWTPRRPADATGARQSLPGDGAPSRALVIGGGLAGAASARSLAARGWQVTVLDQAVAPAAGASGLPAGLVAPHLSIDDGALSGLTRAGVRATLACANALLREGTDWQLSGVLEHRVKPGHDLPHDWLDPASPGQAWSHPATAQQLAQAGLGADQKAHWHPRAAWIRPAALVQALLAHPGITWRGGQAVARLQRTDSGATPAWQALDALGQTLASADIVVLAAGYDTGQLLEGLGAPPLPVDALRGQIAWGLMPERATPALPPFPVNGAGSLISGVGLDGQPAWIFGSTFERGCADAAPRPADTQANFAKLAVLLPAAAAALRPQFEAGLTRAWAAVRCTAPDRVPIVGAVQAEALPGLWVCTAMGARGITLSVLCGELLAALLHGEPLALPLKQARTLSPGRWRPRG